MHQKLPIRKRSTILYLENTEKDQGGTSLDFIEMLILFQMGFKCRKKWYSGGLVSFANFKQVNICGANTPECLLRSLKLALSRRVPSFIDGVSKLKTFI